MISRHQHDKLHTTFISKNEEYSVITYPVQFLFWVKYFRTIVKFNLISEDLWWIDANSMRDAAVNHVGMTRMVMENPPNLWSDGLLKRYLPTELANSILAKNQTTRAFIHELLDQCALNPQPVNTDENWHKWAMTGLVILSAIAVLLIILQFFLLY